MIFSGRGCVPRAHLAGRACSAGGRARPSALRRATPARHRSCEGTPARGRGAPWRANARPRRAWHGYVVGFDLFFLVTGGFYLAR